MKKLTPVLVVDDVSKSIAFYANLGFETRVVMPEENPWFATLESGAVEIMLETRAGMLEDIPAAAEAPTGFSGVIYIEVDDVDAILARARGKADVVTERREAPYGMSETILRDPDGYIVTFGQRTSVPEAVAAG